jgi:hypothetical protein
MQGRIVVSGVALTPPSVSTAPTVSGLKATRARGSIRAAFSLSQPADLRLRITRLRHGKPGPVVRTADRTGRQGSNSLKLPTGRLRPGAYRLTLIATNSIGLSSTPVHTRFVLRKP